MKKKIKKIKIKKSHPAVKLNGIGPRAIYCHPKLCFSRARKFKHFSCIFYLITALNKLNVKPDLVGNYPPAMVNMS